MNKENCLPSPTLYKSMRKHVFTQELQLLISNKMTPFKESYTQTYMAVPRQLFQQQDHETKLEEVITKLDAADIITDSIREISMNALKKTNMICSNYLNTVQRSLLFQILPLINTGLTVIVSPYYIALKQRLQRIKDLVNWAAINHEISQAQIAYILSNLSTNQIQLLIVHPDLVNQIQIQHLNIQMLVLDQANQYMNTDLTRISDMELPPAECTHILLPLVQEAFMIDLRHSKQWKTYRSVDLQETSITCSRDENPIRQLTSLLKSQRLVKKTGILIYCCGPEAISTQLQNNGFRCGSIAGKTETQRQEIYHDFASGTCDLLVLTSGTALPEGLKNFVFLTVHLYIPVSIENYLFDIQDINRTANSHIFLCDEYYFHQRAELASKMIAISSIDKLLHERIYVNEILQNDNNDIKFWLSQNWLQKEKQESSKIKKILIQETIGQLDITRNIFIHLLEQLQSLNWISREIILPVEIFIYSDGLTYEHILITNALTYGKKCIFGKIYQNGYRCKVDDLISGTEFTSTQCLNQLRQMKIRFDVMEEVQIIKIINIPSQSEIQAKVIDLYTTLKRKNIIKINNLDITYLMVKVGSYRSLDYMWKQIQLRPEESKTISFIKKYLDFDQYIEVSQLCEQENLKGCLPFTRLETQRDKSTLLQDVKIIYERESNSESWTWIEKENFATKALMILQGLKGGSSQMQEWKSLNIWAKYRTYNYNQVHEAVHSMIDLLQAKEQILSKKKVKL